MDGVGGDGSRGSNLHRPLATVGACGVCVSGCVHGGWLIYLLVGWIKA